MSGFVASSQRSSTGSRPLTPFTLKVAILTSCSVSDITIYITSIISVPVP